MKRNSNFPDYEDLTRDKLNTDLGNYSKNDSLLTRKMNYMSQDEAQDYGMNDLLM